MAAPEFRKSNPPVELCGTNSGIFGTFGTPEQPRASKLQDFRARGTSSGLYQCVISIPAVTRKLKNDSAGRGSNVNRLDIYAECVTSFYWKIHERQSRSSRSSIGEMRMFIRWISIIFTDLAITKAYSFNPHRGCLYIIFRSFYVNTVETKWNSKMNWGKTSRLSLFLSGITLSCYGNKLQKIDILLLSIQIK